jgi:nucleoside-diphosphate-sugar epimerase
MDWGMGVWMRSIAELEEGLSRPGAEDLAFVRELRGDILILGGGGKMGPSLARLARRASDDAGIARRVITVSRSGGEGDAIACDLLDRDQYARLPDCPNVLFLAGRKFGSAGDLPLTWATNTLLPSFVAERYGGSRVVVLSSGNVYPLGIVGATEQTAPAPVGEYAQSVLGRERVFEYYSNRDGLRAVMIRLNYAVDLRYGVLLDIGQKVLQGRPVSLVMGRVNVIWQGDANSYVLRALVLASSPAGVLNVTGPETLGVRWIAEQFGTHFGVEPVFTGQEGVTALLSDSSECERLLGPVSVRAEELIGRQAEWIRAGLPTLEKPTHFEVRDGRF